MARRVTPLKSLGERIAAALDEHTAERKRAIDAARDGFLADAMQPAKHRSRSTQVVMVAAAALAMVVAGWFAFFWFTKPLQFTVDDGAAAAQTWLAAPRTRALGVRFSDGTRLNIDPSSRARVVDINRHGANIALETGMIHADVVHTKSSRWLLIAGPFAVRVTGTRFDLGWDSASEQFSIAVREGSVAVSGSLVGAERAVSAGQTLRVSIAQGRFDWLDGAGSPAETPHELNPPPGTAEAAKAASAETGSANASESAVAVANSEAPVRDPKAPPWRAFARSGDLRRAFAAAEAHGFAAACAAATASELLVLGDAARLAERPDRAVEALLALRRRYPRDPRRAAAAFALGKVAFDQRHAYREASDWFATCLREQPDGPLARESAGRRIEALRNAGEDGPAAQAAREYLSRYPDGPHAGVAKSVATVGDSSRVEPGVPQHPANR
jgi:transmembrane sensor